MNPNSWRSQIAEGRVFELRSMSKRYPAPCALVIDERPSGWNSRIFAGVDQFGVIGHGSYTRPHNPAIYVDGLRREQFNSSRILRRRRDLERFDADDLALIRYGLSLDFSGCIRGNYNDMSIPTVVPAEWTVFWLAAWDKDDYRWCRFEHDAGLRRLLHGAWHFESHGGSRHLGYRFGRAWATRHSGSRLREIRQFLRSHWGGLIEQPVKVARWSDGQNIYTEEIRRECPALGSRACLVQTPGASGFTQAVYGVYR
jgi:hypothetical protein